MPEPSTPLMRQYSAIKKEHPAALLFFRLGDFYEMFFEDAVVAAKELDITLTSRNKEKGLAIPMCGVPYHAAEGYISKLVRRGYRVAICEQVEDPRLAKTLVRREVRRVVTPGTAADSSLGSEENNFLAAAVSLHDLAGNRPAGNTDVHHLRAGFAALDLSTGEFRATEFSGENAEKKIQDELDQLRPKELLYASSAPLFEASGPVGTEPLAGRSDRSSNPWALTAVEDWTFSPDHAIPLLENHFGVLSLEGLGLAGKPAASAAAGAILHYVRSTQRGGLDHVDRIGFYERQSALVLDAVTVRNLELLEPLFAGGDAVTLFHALDATSTPMGRRLLRAWMLRPSVDEIEIGHRLDAVEALLKNTIAREELRRSLAGILDLERLLSRVTLETANPRDLLALAASLARIPGAKAALARLNSPRLESLQQNLDELADIRGDIERTIIPEPPIALNDGGVIASGVDGELDDLRGLSRNGKQFLAQMEERERQRTGIHSLKVRFNSVFGYHLEISKSNLHLVPPDYERRQTLANAERFSTPVLKEYESKILDAEQKIVEIERRIFAGLRSRIAGEARRIRQSALALAEIDVLTNFAQLAAERGYSRPQFDQTGDIEIIAGRHPVIEQQDLSGQDLSAYDAYKNDYGSRKNSRFVPNDLYLNSTTHTLLLVTGPNMGGKSTYLRQAALMVIMAQMGSFVPASKARLSIVDRVFTRIGASDNLARGRSTFMVEMTETAAILNTATAKSLILLDEVGRGTATYDGLAIAWAAIEYLHAHTRAKTLFATHYFELTELAEQLSGVKNYHVAVKETAGGIVFLRQVLPGAADRSYGIEVAKLAGLPDEVIRRAREVLSDHENAGSRLTAHIAGGDSAEGRAQLTIFTPLSQPVVEKIRELDLDSLTPLAALNLLAELKKQVR
jgi:DNA mismatch repair protein MutS